MTDSQKDMFQRVLPELEKSNLIGLIFQQVEKIQLLESTIDRLSNQNEEQQEEIARLQKELGKAQRAVHRQNAPFRKEKRAEKKSDVLKTGGRSKGHKGSYRQPSAPITEQIIVPLEHCPHCQSEDLSNIQPLEQIIEELDAIKLRIVDLQLSLIHI